MSHLDEQDLNRIREALHGQRNALLEQIRDALEESGEHQFPAVLGQSPGDSSDEALASSLADLSAARIDHEIRRLRELDAAIKRLDAPGFGMCVDCDLAIPLERLLINPAAERCVICQAQHEKTYAGQEHGSL